VWRSVNHYNGPVLELKMHSQGEAMTRLEKQVKENEHEIDGLKERLRSVVVSVDEEEKGPTQ